ncbi:phytanoyl-CoA dioxygenase family protein [Pseudomonas sp.]|uniref:phytanoyl-CoA dioxygenase family protein n=1 Tax=Pseudomonas sp. TaxID=306 RepID=UPI003D6F0D53
MSFASQGYAVIPAVVCDDELAFARELANGLIDRYRRGEEAVLSVGVNIGDAGRRHPQRNPGINLEQWRHEPFIIGDLIALEPRFARLFSQQSIWNCVAELFGCAPSDLLFHFSNLTRKPSEVGPAIGWHRDAENTYFASQDGRTVRLLIPLQFMSGENGGTAVVPSSHLEADAATDCALCPEVPPGGCLVLHSATLHGGSPNRSGQERDVIVIQFGLRSSTLRCKAPERLALSTREDLLAFYRNLVEGGA